ncbi:MAG: MptD family putative ECF transporter S component [Lachnospiraceae bacterium]
MAEKLTIKDLVTTGIFSALLCVTLFIGGVPLAINPVTTFYTSIGAAVLGGPVLLLLIAKVPKRGPLIITGILIGLFCFLTGMHWGQDLGYVITGIIADLIAGSGKYKNTKMNILAYSVFCLGLTGAYIVYFADPTGWAATMLANGTTQSYIDTMNAAANPAVLVVMFAGTIGVAILSGWVGRKLLKKQFEKAGITA